MHTLGGGPPIEPPLTQAFLRFPSDSQIGAAGQSFSLTGNLISKGFRLDQNLEELIFSIASENFREGSVTFSQSSRKSSRVSCKFFLSFLSPIPHLLVLVSGPGVGTGPGLLSQIGRGATGLMNRGLSVTRGLGWDYQFPPSTFRARGERFVFNASGLSPSGVLVDSRARNAFARFVAILCHIHLLICISRRPSLFSVRRAR